MEEIKKGVDDVMAKNKKSLSNMYKDVLETLDEHEQRIGKQEKVTQAHAKEIMKLEQKVRDSEIREKIAKGESYASLGSEYGLTKGRLSQIKNS